jgi:hypothetical protein
MIPGAPDQAGWIRAEPRRSLPAPLEELIVHAVFPHSRVIDAERLTDGLRNANFRLRLDSRPEFIVLRVYEHHTSLCQKELDLIGLLTGSVRVPEVIYAQPRGWDQIPPFILTCNVEGIGFEELKRRGDPEAIAQASRSAGETLASIGRRTFSKPGWLGPGPGVTGPLLEGTNQMPRFVDACLVSPILQRRMQADVRERTGALMWSLAPQLSHLETEAFLVHGDSANGTCWLEISEDGGEWWLFLTGSSQYPALLLLTSATSCGTSRPYAPAPSPTSLWGIWRLAVHCRRIGADSHSWSTSSPYARV